MAAVVLAGIAPAYAIETVTVRADAPAIDLTEAIEWQRSEDGSLFIARMPSDLTTQRGRQSGREVKGRNAPANWAIFALENTGDHQLERLIVAPHYHAIGRIAVPNLRSAGIAGMMSTSDERPEREVSANADVFRVRINPGSVVTYIAEMRAEGAHTTFLWDPDAFAGRRNVSFILFYSIMASGCMALALMLLFFRRRGVRRGQ
jgi:hypothetical protein